MIINRVLNVYAFKIELIIFGLPLEIGLLMLANGTDTGSLSTNMEMPALAAFPDCDLLFFENGAFLYTAQQSEVAFLVLFLYLAHCLEIMGNLVKANLGGNF